MGNAAGAKRFSNDLIPSQSGKIAVVTGGNTGLGFAISLQLASKGATVYIASRNQVKVDNAVAELKKRTENNNVHGIIVDVTSLSSIDVFAESLAGQIPRLDLLVDNAGLFIPPFSKTELGFDITLGTNVIGTVYLTSKVLPLLMKSPAARIVVISAYAITTMLSHALFMKVVGRNDFGGEKLEAKDTSMDLYLMSKMLQTMHATELQRRLDAKGMKNIFVSSAHPGLVATGAYDKCDRRIFFVRMAEFIGSFIGTAPEVGALSPLFLATAEENEIAPFRGGFIREGPLIHAVNMTNKDYTPENCAKVYDGLYALIEKKGFTPNKI